MPVIYLSFARGDEALGHALRDELTLRGYEVLRWEGDDLAEPFESVREDVQRLIERSDALVAVLSQAAPSAPQLRGEVELALAVGKPVVAVTLGHLPLGGALGAAAPHSAPGFRIVAVPPDASPDEAAAIAADFITRGHGGDTKHQPPAAPSPAQPSEGDVWDGAEEERGVPAAPPSPAVPPPPPAPGWFGRESPDWSGSAWPVPAPASPPPPPAPASPARPSASAGSPARGSASAADEPLSFAAYTPASVPAAEWASLLVYAHVAAALEQIKADAATFTELGSSPTTAHSTANRVIAQGVELTIEPHMDGVTFSPPADSFIWRGAWHRSLFRFQGSAALAGTTRSGWIDVYAGGLVPIARIDLSVPFRAPGLAVPDTPPSGLIVTGSVHDRVFISYSHADREAFEQACAMYKRFGIQVYCDEQLAAGDDYVARLGAMIDAASVFHLLWSAHSAASPECRKEWEQALHREPSERFIKPWFWKRPLVKPPDEFSRHHISFRYQHLQRKWWKPSTW